jgi:hypothetical protein
VACVVKNARGDAQLSAFIIARKDSPVKGRQIRDFLRRRLPGPMLPRGFVFLEALPLNANGKVDRARLSAMSATTTEQTAFKEPVTRTEKIIAAVWSDLFDGRDIGAQDDFYDLGGDSLVAAVITGRLGAELGVRLDLRFFADHARLADFAAAVDAMIESSGAASAPNLSRSPRTKPLPLSWHQERLWRLCQESAETESGNIMHRTYRMSGALDVSVLRAALDYLVARHEILRTTFDVVEGQPVQMMHPPAGATLDEFDTSMEVDAEDAAMRLLARERARAISLKTGPVLRFVLVRVRHDLHLMSRINHHIISDGWSWQVFSRELEVVFDALSRGETPPIPAHEPLQYGDYAVWQRERLAPGSPARRELVGWWKETFANQPGLFMPPFLRTKPEEHAPPHEGIITIHDNEAVRSMTAIGRQEGVTFFVQRAAVMAAYLAAKTGRNDLTLGAYVTDRNLLETQHMFGFFANLMPLRLRFDRSLTFREWLLAVRDVLNRAQAHASMPFDPLCEELRLAQVEPPEITFLMRMPDPAGSLKLGNTAMIPVMKHRNSDVMPSGFVMTFAPNGKEDRQTAMFDARIYDPALVRAGLAEHERMFGELARRPDEVLDHIISAIQITPASDLAAGAIGTVRTHDNLRELQTLTVEIVEAVRMMNDTRLREIMRSGGRLHTALHDTTSRSGPDIGKQRASFPAEMSADDLYGFERVEGEGQKTFRWGHAVCALRVLPPARSDHVVLRLHPFAPNTPPPLLWLDGRALPFLAREGLRLVYDVPEKAVLPHPAWLVIASHPLQFPGDTRTLGLPLHRVKFQAVSDEKNMKSGA